TLEDVETMLGEIERIAREHPRDARVEERVLAQVGNLVLPFLGNYCEQLTEQTSQVQRQGRNLPGDQVNWTALDGGRPAYLRDFPKLRRLATRCLSLVTHERHRRIVQELCEHIDRKVEVCRRLRNR